MNGTHIIELAVTKVDNRLVAILPDSLAARLRAADGAKLHAVESAAGVLFTALDEETATQLDVAIGVMEEDREALRRLAE